MIDILQIGSFLFNNNVGLYGLNFHLYEWCKTTFFITVKAEKMDMEEYQIPNNSKCEIKAIEIPDLNEEMKKSSNTNYKIQTYIYVTKISQYVI